MSGPANDDQDLTPEQEKRLSEGVQLQFLAEALFEQFIHLASGAGVKPNIALGAIAALAGEFIFRMHSDPQARVTNRMAFDAAVRNTLGALAAVEEKGVQAATIGMGRLEEAEHNANLQRKNIERDFHPLKDAVGNKIIELRDKKKHDPT
jgi:hypothetical protein